MDNARLLRGINPGGISMTRLAIILAGCTLLAGATQASAQTAYYGSGPYAQRSIYGAGPDSGYAAGWRQPYADAQPQGYSPYAAYDYRWNCSRLYSPNRPDRTAGGSNVAPPRYCY